jgi:opacity protein-like surface antigen
MKMKKILLLTAVLFGLNTLASAQDGSEDKNFRFGLKGDLSLDWLNPDNDKKFESNGVGIGYDWGLQLEFKINKTLSFVSGLSLKNSSGSLKYFGASSADSTFYILDKDEEFVPFDTAALGVTTNTAYFLQNRKYSINYVNIPVILKMKTNEIGYLTYFGQFGANIGIKTKARVNDESKLVNGNVVSKEKLDISDGVQPVRFGITIGGGAEYNFSGSTSMFFGLQYNHYFTNALTSEKREKYLRKYNSSTNTYENVGAKALARSVSLTIGILF